MSQVLAQWNKGELDSFLIEITSNILKYKDADGKTYNLNNADLILPDFHRGKMK